MCTVCVLSKDAICHHLWFVPTPPLFNSHPCSYIQNPSAFEFHEGAGKKTRLPAVEVCVCVCEKGRQKVEWEGCVEQCNCSRVMNKSTEINRKRNLWYFCLIFNLWYATLTLNGCLAYSLVDYTHKHVHTNNEIQLHAHTCTHIASGFWNNALFFWTALDSFGICAAHSSLSLSLCCYHSAFPLTHRQRHFPSPLFL